MRKRRAALVCALIAVFGISGTPAFAERPPPTVPDREPTARVAKALPAAADDGGSTIAVAPVRILDTRTGLGRGGAAAPVGGGQGITIVVAGTAGVPANATAVVLNVTATEATAGTFVTAWPAGEARPLASNLNVVAGQTTPNLVTVGLGAGGAVSLYNNAGATHLIADVQAYVVPQGATPTGMLVDLAPARLLDTRTGGGAVGGGQAVALDVTEVGGVPETGVSAVVLNVTATEPTAASYVTAYPAGGTRPLASNLNTVPGDTVPNRVIVPVGEGGAVRLYNNAGSVHLVVDVGGYLTDGSVPDTGSGLTRVSPARLLDTRPSGALTAGGTRTVQVAGRAGVPGTDSEVPPTAVVLNLTATAPTAASYLTTFPGGSARPLASDLNVRPGETRPNLVVVKLGPTGAVTVYNNAGDTHIVVDVFAYYTGAVVLDPALEVLTPPVAGAVTGVGADTVTFTGTAAGLGLSVGQVLASGPTPGAPSGFLRRVTALAESGGVVTATAVPAALDEAVLRGTYDGGIDLVPVTSAADVTASGITGSVTAPFDLQVDGVDGNPDDAVSASASVSGSLTLSAGLDLRAKIGPFSGVEVDFEAELGASMVTDVSVTGAYELFSREYELFEQQFRGFLFTIGPVPVYVEPEFELGLGVTGSAEASIGVRTTRSETVSLGFRLRNADLQPFTTSTGTPLTHTVTGPDASVNLSAELRATLEAEFYGGFELGVGVAPGITATVGTQDCGFSLDFTVDALAEFEVEMFGKEIGEGVEFSTQLFEQNLLKKTVPGCEPDGWTITGRPAADLATLLAGPGVAIQSATASGGSQVAEFTAPFGSIGLEKGVVLSTGTASGAPGPNSQSGYGTLTGGPGDSALSAIAGGTTYDTAGLDVTFVPTTSTVEFSFVFASEEYLEYVDSQYNDVFGGFVNGVNCAVVDKGFERVPATVNAINHLRNTLQFRDNTGGGTNAQADGMTTTLRCRAPVHPGVPNTLRLAIADTGDPVYDSWAFIQRGSFRAV
ncbi:choice-of-anchor L domain-containing protein [Saccharothrix sp. NRRL B-16348]|uniref:choice-of-anchor L domain-containing protein n=1 Tax=Saccharothrix sp. NRRL B-16348 TaxID=1415542 RepID=UPI000A676BA3|nr:choice-of-anchor L domain-containing protein [Saccharothrix sp. NRRL B-16348]